MVWVGLLLGIFLAVPAVQAAEDGARPSAMSLYKEFTEASAKHESVLEGMLARGQKKAAGCRYCHGVDGIGTDARIPHLAGQNPVYLIDQLLRFRAQGERRTLMGGVSKELSDMDILALSLHYSRLQPASAAADAALAAQGQPLYQSRCQHCHGPDGHGEQGYARVAGQQAPYMQKVLGCYRGHERGCKDEGMLAITEGLTEADISALCAYVASLK